MDYHEELYAIHGNWVNGRMTKRDAVVEFENLLKRNGLIPRDTILDPNLDDGMFLELLNKAFSLKAEVLAWLQKQAQSIIVPQAAIVPSIKCPICLKGSVRLFNEVNIKEQDEGDQIGPSQIFKLSPPRCESCAREFLDVHVFKIRNPSPPIGTLDLTRVSPLSTGEKLFFLPYERQMQEPDKS